MSKLKRLEEDIQLVELECGVYRLSMLCESDEGELYNRHIVLRLGELEHLRWLIDERMEARRVDEHA